jgi:hypothetical protein
MGADEPGILHAAKSPILYILSLSLSFFNPVLATNTGIRVLFVNI